MSTERRHFSRIHFQTDATLHTPAGEYPVEIVDLSLKGALVRPGVPTDLPDQAACSLKLALDSESAQISMDVVLVHREGPYLGLACREIDLDSMTHLRRLVELNLGDESLLQRELSALLLPETQISE